MPPSRSKYKDENGLLGVAETFHAQNRSRLSCTNCGKFGSINLSSAKGRRLFQCGNRPECGSQWTVSGFLRAYGPDADSPSAQQPPSQLLEPAASDPPPDGSELLPCPPPHPLLLPGSLDL